MASTVITCADCGAEHTAKRSDAKYCPSDRLLRVLLFSATKRSRPKRCRSCVGLFLPMHAKDLSHCGSCEAATRPAYESLVDCAFCGRAGHPALSDSPVPVCVACAKDPDVRPKIIRALKKGRANRKAQHAH